MDNVRSVLHDIKNQLGLINGISDTLKMTLGSDGDHTKDLEFVEDLSGRLVASSKLTLSRVANLEEFLKHEEAPMEKITISDQKEIITQINKSYNLKLILDLDECNSHIFYAKVESWQRIITNIFDNAKKAGAYQMYVECDLTPRTVQFRFKDNGCGMREEELRELGFGFSKNKFGSGNGTEIIRLLAAEFGGYAHWTSIYNLGTCVNITMRRWCEKSDRPS